MPYKTDKISLGSPFFDKRTKLIPCQKLKVRWLHEQGDISMASLAQIFRVTPFLIRMIVVPGYAEKQKVWRTKSGGSVWYYNKTKHAKELKIHRNYKRLLFIKLNPDLLQ